MGLGMVRGLRSVGAAALLAGLLTTLAACGFTPLYAEPGVVPALTHIEVRNEDTRTGFMLREGLEDSLGWNRSEPARYRLVVASSETRAALGRRLDETATRYQLTLTVSYVLTDAASGATVTQGAINAVTNYAASDQAYAGLVAHEDGQNRAARQAADLIRGELARFFADQGRAAPAAR
ncbi:MAG TPA: LPS assembly lipoprotein LptE [Caulobacteraceae bacterium]|jgi:LPS-assembly lipoprotein